MKKSFKEYSQYNRKMRKVFAFICITFILITLFQMCLKFELSQVTSILWCICSYVWCIDATKIKEDKPTIENKDEQ